MDIRTSPTTSLYICLSKGVKQTREKGRSCQVDDNVTMRCIIRKVYRRCKMKSIENMSDDEGGIVSKRLNCDIAIHHVLW